ncbi:MAG: HAMP domain-containing histidine kinase [Myxococcales bacterium]|nr:HAMP domain-containing histidine kinase [Myxococcales bacterium]
MNRRLLFAKLLHFSGTVFLPLFLTYALTRAFYTDHQAQQRRQSLMLLQDVLASTAEVSGHDVPVLIDVMRTAFGQALSVRDDISAPGALFHEIHDREQPSFHTCLPLQDETWLCQHTPAQPPPLWLWIPALLAALLLTIITERGIRRTNRIAETQAKIVAHDIDTLTERLLRHSAETRPTSPQTHGHAPLHDRSCAPIYAGLQRLEQTYQHQAHAQMRSIDEGRDARRQKARMVAAMGHDMKGALSSLIGFSELLLKGIDGPLPQALLPTVQHIAAQSERFLLRIANLVDTARIETRQFDLDIQWVPTVEILTDCAAGIRRIIAAHPIEYESRISPGLPPVQIDRERIFRAILTLTAEITDALSQGHIQLNAYRKPKDRHLPQRIVVEIIDIKNDLPAAHRQKLRDIFAATEGFYERADVGATGLSISLARRVIRLHGGDVFALQHDETADPGRIFSIYLPLE